MKPTFITRSLALLAITFLFSLASAGTAPSLKPGDILVVDNQYGVILVNPETGAQTVVSRGGCLNSTGNSARGIALEADG